MMIIITIMIIINIITVVNIAASHYHHVYLRATIDCIRAVLPDCHPTRFHC